MRNLFQQTKFRSETHNRRRSGKEKEDNPKRKTDESDTIYQGQHQYFFSVGSMLLADGMITIDPIQIHDRLTEAFAEHLMSPQLHKNSPLQSDDGIDHERFLTDEEYFKATVSKIPDKIRTAALESIRCGISHVPKRP